MLEFKQIDVEETPYFYDERTCTMDPSDIGKNMQAAFQKVWAFMEANSIPTTGKAMSVYYTYNPETITFRTGFSVAKDDLAKAKEAVEADLTPAGKVLAFTHIGPYATLRNSYAEMMKYIETNGLKLNAPTWEVYVDDPRTTPEAELRTDVFAKLD